MGFAGRRLGLLPGRRTCSSAKTWNVRCHPFQYLVDFVLVSAHLAFLLLPWLETVQVIQTGFYAFLRFSTILIIESTGTS